MGKCSNSFSCVLIEFVRDLYKTNNFIPLHAPTFSDNEYIYIKDTIDSTFVSSVGAYVDKFEHNIQEYTHSNKAVATVNGTSALHAALYMSGVSCGDLVLTQALTFVATCNAISQLGASPVFIDVDRDTLGLSPVATENWLVENAFLDDLGTCIHKETGAKIKAVVPMHTFGHPVEVDKLMDICKRWHLDLIEDAAESLGSLYRGQHTGTFGRFGIISFNGNKIITTGGGGMLLCRSLSDGERVKHVTTTAKVPHPYEFIHDELAFNYRLPNLNAALGCAQFKNLEQFIQSKRQIASNYDHFFKSSDYAFIREPAFSRSNYWLNAVIVPNIEERDSLLTDTNSAGVMTRPVWKLMHKLPMFSSCNRGDLSTSEWLEQRIVNLPSSPIMVM